VKKGQSAEHPLYIITCRMRGVVLVFHNPAALFMQMNMQDCKLLNFYHIGAQESFTNQVIEIVVEKDAPVEYYKFNMIITLRAR